MPTQIFNSATNKILADAPCFKVNKNKEIRLTLLVIVGSFLIDKQTSIN